MADDLTTEEKGILWFLQTCGPVREDLKSLLVESHRHLVDGLISRGLIEQRWTLSEEGDQIATASWKALEKERKAKEKSFRLGGVHI